MEGSNLIVAAGLLVMLGMSFVSSAEEPAQITWDLSDLYASPEQWEKARAEIGVKVAEVQPLRGHLGESAANLKSALDVLYDLKKIGSRLGAYATMLSDSDTRESGPQGMKQAMQQQRAEVKAQLAWIDPEILAIPTAKIQSFLATEPGLGVYRRHLERLENKRPHTRSVEVESVLGLTEMLEEDGGTIGSLLVDAEIPFRTISLADGSELKVDVAGYTRGRARPNRADRIAIYSAFYGELAAFQQSLTTALAATVKGHLVKSRARQYAATLEAALAENEVDPAVYRMLVNEVNASLPVLHRYLKLRARMLGIHDLAYYDLYPPLVGTVKSEFPWAKAESEVLAALQPMGSDYVDYLRHAYDNRWVDVFPRDGKRSGAYMIGAAYDVHPYMLLNHQDDYVSASTLAHESGHLMHSHYSNSTQPYPMSDYETFVAEVASTTAEWLFFKHSLAAATTDDERLAILGNSLESMRTTVFRQTMFAEFERSVHELVENGQPLTAEALNSLYLGLLRKYHGHDQNVCRIDDLYGVEWAYVPHFHYNYYVYTYATSYVAATAFAEAILDGKNGGAHGYIDNVLKAGCSKPPVTILKDAGVDMTTPAPIQATVRAMNDVMDQIEEILDRRK